MSFRARRLGLGLLALATAAAPVVVPHAVASPPVLPGLAFGPGQPVDPQRDESEPNIEIDKEGRIYTCGPTGFTTGADYAQVSTDGGDQFHLLGTPPRGQLADRGGGDCYISTGKQKKESTGTYSVSYIGLADGDFTTATSDDYGASFAATPTTCSGATDRQWTTFIDATTSFVTYNDVARGPTVVQKSTNGGLTYDGYGPCGATAQKDISTTADFPGPMTADDNGAHNEANPGQPLVYFGFNDGNTVGIAVSLDSGDTWTRCLVAETDADPSNGFVVLDKDLAGNLYVSWGEKGGEEGAFRAMFSWLPVSKIDECTEPDENPGWSTPVQVDRPPTRTLVFPWLVASGLPGRVAIAWYGSTTSGVADAATFKGPWDVYVAQSVDAMNAEPTWTQTKATSHPLHYDQICLSGLACTTGGDRSLADFFAMALDPVSKRLVVVYNESHKLPDAPLGSIALPNVLVQSTGESNLGGRLAPKPRPVNTNGYVDPEGDAQAPYSVSSLTLPVAPPAASRANHAALDVTGVRVDPETDLETGEVADDGGFTVTITVDDLDDAALQAALTGAGGQSLIWAFRWVNGYQPASLSVHWDPVRGFGGGFDDFATGSVTCIGTESKCITYPGATAVPFDVDQDSGEIRMTVPRNLLEAFTGLDDDGRPVVGEATASSRFYSGTVFTMSNTSVNEAQGFLYPVDGTAAFDFTLPAKDVEDTDENTDEDTDEGTDGDADEDDDGTMPATGGLGWPLAAVALAAAAVVTRRVRRRA